MNEAVADLLSRPRRLTCPGLALLLLIVACRSSPAPLPATEPPPPESAPQAAARCARELSDCRYPVAIEKIERIDDACRNRGVMPGPGDPCYRPVTARRFPEFVCRCDACRADGECPQPGYCRKTDLCRDSATACFTGARPAVETCLEPPRTSAPVP